MPESLRYRLSRWGVEGVLEKYGGLRLVATRNGGVEMAGVLSFTAAGPTLESIEDEYQIRLIIPERFPTEIPSVRETGRRIPRDYHKLVDGDLCLGSPTRLRLALKARPTLLGFVESCIIPYLYGRSHFERYGKMPFGELDHGTNGIRQDLALLFGTKRSDRVGEFARLTAMKKRHANKLPCPCGSGMRLGRCHHLHVNWLREQLGRGWFSYVRNSGQRTE